MSTQPVWIGAHRLLEAAYGLWAVWRRTAIVLVDGQIDLFLGRHRLGQLTRPAGAEAQPEEILAMTLGRRRRDGEPILVVDGWVIGVIPRRRLAPELLRKRCAEVMVALPEIPLLRSTDSARRLEPDLSRLGVALVIGEAGGLGYVEERELLERFLLWSSVRSSVGAEGGKDR